MEARRYEYVGGASRKFWEVRLHKSQVEVTYGRIGTNGQEHVKYFETPEDASHYFHRKITEKLGKGYRLKFTDKRCGPAALKGKHYRIPSLCAHTTITKKGDKYQCASCKKVVEFGPSMTSRPKTEEGARRFFNLSWRKTA